MSKEITANELRKSALSAHQSGDFDEALKRYSQFLSRYPENGSTWSNLGALFRAKGQFREAVRAHRRAYSLSPNNLGVRNNLANVLSDIGEYDESIGLRKTILEEDPNNKDQLAMIGRCLRGQGKYQQAINHLRQALKENGKDTELRMQLAFALLAAGKYKEGFRAYGARWETDEISQKPMDLPEWAGESLKGKSIVVVPEQGFGDAVFANRFLPYLKSLGAAVKLLVEKPTEALFQELEGADEICAFKDHSVKADYWVNAFDLLEHYFNTHTEIPEPSKLSIPNDSIEKAAKLCAPYKGRFKVGVVWTGSTTFKRNAFRSFDHKEFDALADIDGVQLFSLYKGPQLSAFRSDGTSAFIVDAAGQDRHFADCAATMKEMDLIVTSDTATAHIAGSLGLPTWVLLHWDPFWVWGHSGNGCDWYPSAKLFRQKVPLDWGSVFANVKQELTALAGTT